MVTTGVRWRASWLSIAIVGLAAAAAACALPWRDDEWYLGVVPRLAMAVTGAALLALVALRPERGAVPATVGVLGASVVAYPTLISTGSADLGGPVVATMSAAGHVLPLTLIQVLPVMASGRGSGRSRRGWLITIVAVAVAGLLVTGAAVADLPGAAAWTVISMVLWLGSFALAPIACWTNVRGTSGEHRRRAIVAGLASLLPVLIIVWCWSLAVIARPLGWTDAIAALMYGFCLAVAACAVLVMAAVGPAGGVLMRTRSVVVTLDLLLVALASVFGGLGVLAASSADLPIGWAILAGAVVAIALGVPWLRIRSWVAKVVDPAAELRHEAQAAGTVGDGQQRVAIVQVLRRVVDDPELSLAFRVADRWIAWDGSPAPGPGPTVVAKAADGSPTVTARLESAAAATRLAALGDCTDVLRPALLEAQAVEASARAERAAAAERERLSQDLHDGLQGRLLGLALHLQLTGRDLDDPTSRLALDETVAALRGLVDDVRALGGGRLPAVLVDDGLSAALSSLIGPLGSRVSLAVPADRLDPATEAVVYFVVAEAVANSLKHAGAAAIGVVVEPARDGRVEVRVTDDGVGGADPRAGSGLRSLAERVASCGGALVVRDGTPGGTVVEAVLPCGS